MVAILDCRHVESGWCVRFEDVVQWRLSGAVASSSHFDQGGKVHGKRRAKDNPLGHTARQVRWSDRYCTCSSGRVIDFLV